MTRVDEILLRTDPAVLCGCGCWVGPWLESEGCPHCGARICPDCWCRCCPSCHQRCPGVRQEPGDRHAPRD